MQAGKVYIVGAGPGHPELLTIKAAELLKTGDVIVYDRLVQEEVLALSKPSAERIYMGKTVGRHDSRQVEIHELLVRKSQEGKTVVRLKGGDPFVFGRGGEEAEYLADHGVPFEVVPGVSSALAAPASAGIAITHRDAGSAVAIVTGHEANRDESRLNWDALAGMDTLVFLMSVSTVRRVAQKLMDCGRDPETPAAMIQMAFWHGEKVLTATLATIADEVERTGVEPPATLVIGEVVRLREKLKQSQRDLLRRPDDGSRFEPAPAPDQLLRLTSGGLAAQVLRAALEQRWFDGLEHWRTPRELASELHLNEEALAEALRCLVSLGLLETGPEGCRNLELASRYLVSDSPHNIRAALEYQASLADAGAELRRYLAEGPDGHVRQPERSYRESCESLARFAAPLVIDKIRLRPNDSLLIAGWGAEAYRDAASRRWPEVRVETLNPFAEGGEIDVARALPPGRYDVVLLSGVLASSAAGQVEEMFAAAASRLNESGTLSLYDSFLPVSAVPPPEVVFSELGRRILRGGCRNWPYERVRGVLEGLGLETVRADTLPAGSLLISARKPAAPGSHPQNP
jgi:uroporphyrin-III C-methyltransferase